MVRCPVCGGTVDSMGGSQYKCPYCSNEFSVSELMVKCSLCGGEVDSLGNSRYRCKYCSHEFSTSSVDVTARSTVTKKSNEGVDVFEQNINGILEIVCKYSNCVSAGSGMLLDKSGYALTNTHVVTDDNYRACSNITVKIAGETVGAKVMYLGDDRGGHGRGVDLALIKLDRVPSKASPVTLGSFNSVRIGEQIFVIGNSLGYGTCMTSGIVSDKTRMVEGKQLLMTDCAINGGNSGGPMFNNQGEVIAVIVSGIDGAEGMNFAIPVSTVEKFLASKGYTLKKW